MHACSPTQFNLTDIGLKVHFTPHQSCIITPNANGALHITTASHKKHSAGKHGFYCKAATGNAMCLSPLLELAAIINQEYDYRTGVQSFSAMFHQ